MPNNVTVLHDTFCDREDVIARFEAIMESVTTEL